MPNLSSIYVVLACGAVRCVMSGRPRISDGDASEDEDDRIMPPKRNSAFVVSDDASSSDDMSEDILNASQSSQGSDWSYSQPPEKINYYTVTKLKKEIIKQIKPVQINRLITEVGLETATKTVIHDFLQERGVNPVAIDIDVSTALEQINDKFVKDNESDRDSGGAGIPENRQMAEAADGSDESGLASDEEDVVMKPVPHGDSVDAQEDGSDGQEEPNGLNGENPDLPLNERQRQFTENWKKAELEWQRVQSEERGQQWIDPLKTLISLCTQGSVLKDKARDYKKLLTQYNEELEKVYKQEYFWYTDADYTLKAERLYARHHYDNAISRWVWQPLEVGNNGRTKELKGIFKDMYNVHTQKHFLGRQVQVTVNDDVEKTKCIIIGYLPAYEHYDIDDEVDDDLDKADDEDDEDDDDDDDDEPKNPAKSEWYCRRIDDEKTKPTDYNSEEVIIVKIDEIAQPGALIDSNPNDNLVLEVEQLIETATNYAQLVFESYLMKLEVESNLQYENYNDLEQIFYRLAFQRYIVSEILELRHTNRNIQIPDNVSQETRDISLDKFDTLVRDAEVVATHTVSQTNLDGGDFRKKNFNTFYKKGKQELKKTKEYNAFYNRASKEEQATFDALAAVKHVLQQGLDNPNNTLPASVKAANESFETLATVRKEAEEKSLQPKPKSTTRGRQGLPNLPYVVDRPGNPDNPIQTLKYVVVKYLKAPDNMFDPQNTLHVAFLNKFKEKYKKDEYFQNQVRELVEIGQFKNRERQMQKGKRTSRISGLRQHRQRKKSKAADDADKPVAATPAAPAAAGAGNTLAAPAGAGGAGAGNASGDTTDTDDEDAGTGRLKTPNTQASDSVSKALLQLRF